MYSIGEKVVYCGHGVCIIDSVEQRMVDRKEVSYFVLKPLDHTNTQFYVPVHNPAALAKLRYLLTPQEMTGLLHSPVIMEDCWITEENRRKLRYKELINSGDFVAIAQMLHAVEKHRLSQLAAGKKFHLCDENFLRDSKRMLEAEICVVLGVPADQIQEALRNLMK